jgi:trehalose synthase-fused probable maltokinase
MLTIDERALIDHVVGQRWFGSKTREVIGARIVDQVGLAPHLTLLLVEVRFPEGTHDVYQLLAGTHEGEPDWFDGFADAALARELVHEIRSGSTKQAAEGAVEFRTMEGFASLGRELEHVQVITSEQSNSSVIFDEEVILKAFRRLEAGVNPELEMLRFLTEHGFDNLASLAGWYAYVGRPLDATLGILQRYVPNAVNGWDLALDELGETPEHFLGRLHRLGEVTAEMHNVLASDANDPAFAPEETSAESLGLLTATVDEEIQRVFLELGDIEALEPIAGRGEDVREQLRFLSHFGTVGRVIRHHGDFHLGQTLWADGDWVLIDFEGEPARSLPERRRKRSPLRDVAGMLRSFAYVASAVEILAGAEAPPGWEERAREEFLDGYLAGVDQKLLPAGRESVERLISIFELEKAVYELRYELNNRPEWVRIPVAGIIRLLEAPAPA